MADREERDRPADVRVPVRRNWRAIAAYLQCPPQERIAVVDLRHDPAGEITQDQRIHIAGAAAVLSLSSNSRSSAFKRHRRSADRQADHQDPGGHP